MKLTYRTNAIYVKPYVKAYYEKNKLGELEMDLLEILLLSDNKKKDWVYKQQPAGHVEWRVPIPEYWHKEGMHTLTLSNARRFSSFLERYIRKIFEVSVIGLVNACNYTQVKVEIKNYLEMLKDNEGLNDEVLSMDALKRHIGRFCEEHKIKFKEVKKSTRIVLYNAANAAKNLPPKGYVWLEDYLNGLGISARTWRRKLKDDIPTLQKGTRLCVRTADAA